MKNGALSVKVHGAVFLFLAIVANTTANAPIQQIRSPSQPIRCLSLLLRLPWKSLCLSSMLTPAVKIGHDYERNSQP